MADPRTLRAPLAALLLLAACGTTELPVPVDGGADAGADAGPDRCAGRPPCTAEPSCDGDVLVLCAPDADGCAALARTDCPTGRACRVRESGAACVFPCAGVSDCSVAGRSCAGNTLVTCAADGDGCLVSSSTDCGAAGDVCNAAAAGGPACVDPCAGLTQCAAAGASCDGDVLTTCQADGLGCLRPSTVDCASLAADCVDAGGGTAQCVASGTCAGRALCSPAGTSCSGAKLVRCALDVDGCLVRTERDCATDGGVCSASGGAHCASPCEGLALCAAAGKHCDSASDHQDLVTCAADTDGCIVETARVRCTATAGHVCSEAASPAACVDRCAGVSNCAAPGLSCDGDTLVDCRADANGCLVRATTACAATGRVCTASSGTAACTVSCAGRATCAQAGSACSGGTLTTCAPDADGCLVQATRDCAASGLTCDAAAGACRTASCEPAIAMGCGSGPVAGDTAGGTTQLSSYAACAVTGVTYGARERIHFFSSPRPVQVTATLTLGAMSANNYNNYYLFLLQGTPPAACADTTACLARSEYVNGGKSTTSLSFAVAPGQGRYLAVDGTAWSANPTTQYTLQVSCTEIVCGDGTRGATEACDDGDTDSGDGCSSQCAVESGWICAGDAPTVCRRPRCGDGAIDAPEACDDGDTDAGDGCGASCAVESGWRCSGAPSACVAGATACTNAQRVSAGTYAFDTTPFGSTYDNYANLCGVGYGGGGARDMTFVASVPAHSMIQVAVTGTWTPRVAVATTCSADPASVQGSCQVLRPDVAHWLNETDTARDVWIVVDGQFDGNPGNWGPYSMTVSLTAQASLAAGQSCHKAIRLTPGTVSGDTTGGLDLYDGYRSTACIGFAHGPDVVYVISVPAGKTLEAVVSAASSYDTSVVLSDSCPALVDGCRAYANVVKPAKATVLNSTAAAKDYYIVVDGFTHRDFGPYTLTTVLK